jgi:hypothetical protein
LLITAAITTPLTFSDKRFVRPHDGFGLLSGLISLAFGIFVVYHTSVVDDLFTRNPIWYPR